MAVHHAITYRHESRLATVERTADGDFVTLHGIGRSPDARHRFEVGYLSRRLKEWDEKSKRGPPDYLPARSVIEEHPGSGEASGWAGFYREGKLVEYRLRGRAFSLTPHDVALLRDALGVYERDFRKLERRGLFERLFSFLRKTRAFILPPRGRRI